MNKNKILKISFVFVIIAGCFLFVPKAEAGRILDESFEGVGYQFPWGAVTPGAGCTIDPDSGGPGSLPPGGGNEAVQMLYRTSDWRGWIEHWFGADHQKTFFRGYIYVDSESLAAWEDYLIFHTWDNAWAPAWWAYLIENDVNELKINFYVYNNGVDNVYQGDTTIQLDNWYRVEVMYDNLANQWEWRINGVTQDSGSLAGAHRPGVGNIYVGNGWLDQANKDIDLYFDLITIDDSGWVGEESIDIASDLVGYWDFEEGSGTQAVDSINGNVGTILGADGDEWISSQPGFGTAIELDGVNDTIRIPDSATLEPMGDMTVSAWVRFDELYATKGEYQKILFYHEDGDPWVSYEIGFDVDDQPFFQWVDQAGSNYYSGGYGGGIQIGDWYHLTGVRTGALTTFYLNGSRVGTWWATSPTGNMYNANGPLYFGSNSDYDAYFNGAIDEVRIYDRALSAAEAAELYEYVSAVTPLQSGVSQAGSAASDEWVYYEIDVPVGATELLVELTNLSADLDLYVMAGELPSDSGWHCGSYAGGTTNETCTIPPDATLVSGTWYIGVDGYAAGSYTIEATVTGGGVDIESGLVGHWQFEEETGNVLDSTSNNNDCTINGDPQYLIGQSGFGQSMDFDGAGDYANCGTDPSVEMGSSDWTIAGWMRTTTAARAQFIGKGAQSDTNEGYGFYYDPSVGDIRFQISDGVNRTTYTSSDGLGLNDGTWHHMVVSADRSGNASFYADGVFVSSVNISGYDGNNITNSGYGAKLGTFRSSELYLDGELDDVRIYERALSPEEVAALHDYNPLNSGLVGHWQFEEGVGSVTADSSGNGNVGTLMNMEGGDWWDNQQGFGKALHFDSYDAIPEYVNVGNDPDLNLQYPITITAWINMDELPYDAGNMYSIVGRDNDGAVARVFDFRVYNWPGTEHHIDFSAYPNGISDGQVGLSGSTDLGQSYVGSWHHVAATVDANLNATIYLDGVPDGSANLGDGRIPANTENTHIGGTLYSDDYLMKGQIDEVRVYNRALTQAEIEVVRDYTPLETGLIGHWRFEGNVNDEVGTSHGTIGGNPQYVDSKSGLGQALEFDGTDRVDLTAFSQYVQPSVATPAEDMPAFTISTWAKRTADDAGGNIIFAKLGHNGGIQETNFVLWGSEGTGVYNGAGGYTVPLNTWYMATMSYDPATQIASCYIDDQPSGSINMSGQSFKSNSNNLEVGGRNNWEFRGVIDEPRIYSRALTAAEVQALYYYAPPQDLTTGLVAHWQFEGDLTDSSQSGNDGTPVNFDGDEYVAGYPGLGQAVDLNGASLDYITTPVDDVLDGVSEVTITAWMRRRDAGDKVLIGRENDPGYTDGLNLQAWNDGLIYFMPDNPAWGTVGHNDTSWHHFAMVFNGNLSGNSERLKGYIDGAEQTLTYSGTVPATTETMTIPMLIGKTNVAGGSSFSDGFIDEVRIYTRALTLSEIQAVRDYTSGPALPTVTGITREWWTGIDGSTVAALTGRVNYPDNPNGRDILSNFETVDWDNPVDYDTWADNYGQRVHGYLIPPTTGSYTFWVGTDDSSELWLNPNGDDPAGAQLIAFEPTYGTARVWQTGDEQSSPISLTAGERYYIMLLHKEGTGGDHAAVAWQGPGISQEIIPGTYLRPYVDIETGLVHQWKFEDNLSDSAGGANGTHSDSPVYLDSGRVGFGRALDFDGSTDYVDMGAMSFFNQATSYSISAWVKPDDPISSSGAVVSKYDGTPITNKTGFMRVLSGNNADWEVHEDNTSGGHYAKIIGTDGGLIPGEWNHIVGTFQGGSNANLNLHLYVNGVEAAGTLTSTGAITESEENTTPVRFGNAINDDTDPDSPIWWYSGVIDEVRFYNKALNAAEVQELYGWPPALEVSLSASPSSGPSPLEDVDLTADVVGTETGTINYYFWCHCTETSNVLATVQGSCGSADASSLANSNTSYTATNACTYTDGTFTPKVVVERGASSAEDRSSVRATPGLYRSVAYDQSNLNTVGATMQISGTTATFSGSGLPDNVGVGDVLVYNSGGYKVAFISGRTSSTVYKVQDRFGGTPTIASPGTSVQIFRAHLTLDRWEDQVVGDVNPSIAAVDATLDDLVLMPGMDLVTNDYIMMVACYGAADSDWEYTYIEGWTTDADHYIKIYTPYLSSEVGTSQRHNGKWTESAYSWDGANFLRVREDHVRIEGLQIYVHPDSGTGVRNWVRYGVIFDSDYINSGSDIRFSHNILKSREVSGQASSTVGLHLEDSDANIYIWNNVIHGFKEGGYGDWGSDGIRVNNYNGMNAYIYNNTIYNCYDGIENYNTGANSKIIAKNNISFGNSGSNDAYTNVDRFDPESTNNAADDDVVYIPGSNPKHMTTSNPTDYFWSSQDFHINPGATYAGEIMGAGADLFSSDPYLRFTDDIDGQIRSGANWDLGADTVVSIPGLVTAASQVSVWTDDAEEPAVGGAVSLSSSDLELGEEGGILKAVGMRFNNLNIPQGATIVDAYIDFTSDESHSGVTNVTFYAEVIDNAITFEGVNNNITNRTKTGASVDWNNIPPWWSAGLLVQTPDLSPIIQEVVGRPGWSEGNSLVVIAEGLVGRRVAVAYDSNPNLAPMLYVTYRELSVSLAAIPDSGTAPLSGVDLRADVTTGLPDTLNYTFYCHCDDSGTDPSTSPCNPWDGKLDNTSNTSHTEIDVCDGAYNSAGTYSAKVIVEQAGYSAEDRTPVVVSGWYNAAWTQRKLVTIDGSKVVGSHTDFPVLIDIGYHEGLAADARNDGYDILFTSADGISKLAHEIEMFDPDVGKLVAWVKIPTLSSGDDTLLWMYYGNSGASNQENVSGVWTNGYAAVWHFAETSGSYLDSSGNGNHGTTVSVSSRTADGKMGIAPEFNGTSDYINVPDDNSLDLTTFTIDGWAGPRDTDGWRTITSKGPDPFNWYTVFFERDLIHENTTTQTRSSTDYTENEWQHFAIISDVAATQVRLYRNAVENAYTSQAWAIPTTNITIVNIGHNDKWGEHFDGAMDELRLSNVVRSDNWLKTQYNNQSDPGVFASVDGAAPDIISGLIGYWPFEGNLYDATVNANHGLPNGDPGYASSKPGLGQALSLNGAGDYVGLGSPASLDISDKSFTVAAWLRPDAASPPAEQTHFNAHNANSTGNSVHLRTTSDGAHRFGFYAEDIVTPTNTITFGDWQHVVVTYDKGLRASKIYRNAGAPIVSGARGPMRTSPNDIYFGAYVASGGEYFKGQIDEMRIYDRALTQEEIAALYAWEPKLSVSLLADPDSGTPPLIDVDLDATVYGTETGNIDYYFWCNCSNTSADPITVEAACDTAVRTSLNNPSDSRTEIAACTYDDPITYTAKVVVVRGAEQAEARTTIRPTMSLYRSVGKDSSDLNVVGATVEISVNTATFDLGLPGNVGVGDVLVYGGNVAFISGRTSPTVYTVQARYGGTPVSAVGGTAVNIYRAHLEMDDWEEAHTNGDVAFVNPSLSSPTDVRSQVLLDPDLVANDYVMMVPCYAAADQTDPDDDYTYIDGWTTNADHYIKIYTPYLSSEVGTSQRHDGQWTNNAYKWDDWDNFLRIRDNHVRIEGLQVFVHPDSGTGVINWDRYGIIVDDPYLDPGNDIRISHNIFRSTEVGGQASSTIALLLEDYDANVYIWNNVIYGFTQGGYGDWGSDCIVVQNYNGMEAYIYNNTIYDCEDGIDNNQNTANTNSKIVLKNNMSFGNDSNDYEGSHYVESTNNASDDGTAPGIDPIALSGDMATDYFWGAQDFHVKPGATYATEIMDAGADLSADPYLSFNNDIDLETRPFSATNWTVGADEESGYQPTQIFIHRSVGNDTSNLNSVSATMQISGTTATFSTGLPDNVGVGDVLVYNPGSGDNVAFISGRTSATEYTVQDQFGGAPTQAGSWTNVAIYRAFLNLDNWENANDVSPTYVNSAIPAAVESYVLSPSEELSDNDYVLMIACYSSPSGADTTSTDIDGWTTDTNHYIKIYTPYLPSEVGVSQRHNGAWTDPTSAYTLIRNGTAIYIRDNHVRVEGIQFEMGDSDTGINVSAYYLSSDNDIRVSHTIFRGVGASTYGIQFGNNPLKARVWNNVFSGLTSRAIYVGWCGDYIIYNNTFYNCNDGIRGTTCSTETHLLKNNIFLNVTDVQDGTWVDPPYDSSTNNAFSDPAQAYGLNAVTLNSTDPNNYFVDAASGDFHIDRTAFNAGEIIDAGVDLSADPLLSFNDDVEMGPRAAPWDLGAEESLDLTPPDRSNLLPSGVLEFDIGQTTISLETNEDADCAYSESATTPFGSMFFFTNTGTKNHSELVSGLSNGTTYTYYVKCRDKSPDQNINPDDAEIVFTVSDTAGWYLSDWVFRREILIDDAQVEGVDNLTDFPVLISLSGLANVAQADGGDILFTLSDRVTKLSHEIEYFDQVAGDLVAWVKVPILYATSDTLLYMYYGNGDLLLPNQENPADVWDSSYKGVYHFESSVSAYDSTLNVNHGARNGPTHISNSQIDGGENFDSANDYILTNSSAGVTGDKLTISFWADADTSSWDTYAMFVGEPYDAGSSWDSPYASWMITRQSSHASEGDFVFADSASSYSSTASGAGYFDNDLHYYTVTRDGTLVIFYKDGVQFSSFTVPANNFLGGYKVTMGTRADYSPDEYYRGTLDEVRISNVARSAEWIKTKYNNQLDPDAFYFVGVEEVSGPDIYPPFRYNLQPSGVFPSNTEVRLLFFETNEDAVCKYSVTAGVDYDLMPAENTFDEETTDPTIHSKTVSGLSPGNVYNFYVKCRDTLGNTNTDDALITFEVTAIETGGLWGHYEIPDGVGEGMFVDAFVENVDYPEFTDAEHPEDFATILINRPNIGQSNGIGVYWTGAVLADYPGQYTFRFDGASMSCWTYFAGAKLNPCNSGNGWCSFGNRSTTTYFSVDAGWHAFSMSCDWSSDTFDPGMQVFWTPPGRSEEIIPKDHMSPQSWSNKIIAIPDTDKPKAKVNYKVAAVGAGGWIPTSGPVDIVIDWEPNTITDEVWIFAGYADAESGHTVTNVNTGVSRAVSATQFTSVHGWPIDLIYAKLDEALIDDNGTGKLHLSFLIDFGIEPRDDGIVLVLPYIDESMELDSRLYIRATGHSIYHKASPAYVFPVEGGLINQDIRPFFVLGDGETKWLLRLRDDRNIDPGQYDWCVNGGGGTFDCWRPNYMYYISGDQDPPANESPPGVFDIIKNMPDAQRLLPIADGPPTLADTDTWYPAFGREGPQIDVVSQNYVSNQWSELAANDLETGGGQLAPLSVPPEDDWIAFQAYGSNFPGDNVPVNYGYASGESAFMFGGGLISSLPIYEPNIPAPPTGLEAHSNECETMDLNWIDNSIDEEYFIIERKRTGLAFFTPIAQVAQNVVIYRDENLGGGLNYTYRVKACNALDECSGYSNEASDVPDACPLLSDFRLNSSNNLEVNVTGVAGERATSTATLITVTPGAGPPVFTEDVMVQFFDDFPPLPSGTTYNFSDIPGATLLLTSPYVSGSEFTVSVPGDTPPGFYSIILTGVSASYTRSAVVILQVGTLIPEWEEF